MAFRDLVESRIQEAMAAGHFSRLRGEGRPQRFDNNEDLAGDNWLGFKILRDADLLPEWLMLARDIERAQERLDRIDRRHDELTATVRASGRWESAFPAIARLRSEYETEARALRRMQDRFNHDAPSIRLERPAIWVEHHLARLDARVSSPLASTR
jgi:hypothetical protein